MLNASASSSCSSSSTAELSIIAELQCHSELGLEHVQPSLTWPVVSYAPKSLPKSHDTTLYFALTDTSLTCHPGPREFGHQRERERASLGKTICAAPQPTPTARFSLALHYPPIISRSLKPFLVPSAFPDYTPHRSARSLCARRKQVPTRGSQQI